MNPPASDSPESKELMICPSCHAPNDPLARYCAQCGVPLASTVMLEPMGQIAAEGFVLREALIGKPSLIVVIGIWLLFFPISVTFGCLILREIMTRKYWSAMDVVSMTPLALFALLPAIVLFMTTSNYIRKRNKRA